MSKRILVFIFVPIIAGVIIISIWMFSLLRLMSEEGYTVYIYNGQNELWSIELEIVAHNETEMNPKDIINTKFLGDDSELPVEVGLRNNKGTILYKKTIIEDTTKIEINNNELKKMIDLDEGIPKPIEMTILWNDEFTDIKLDYYTAVTRE